ncbi:MAG: ABC transporter permease [Corynebacterium matruchotii]
MTLSRLIRRPELASALGALVIFIFFMIVAPAFRSLDAFATTLYASSTLGIVALAVGLLMIGDEFDLSSGVAVTTAALAATMLNYNLGLNSWVGAFLSLIVALGIGALNGYLVTRTGIASFLITLAAFLMLQGLNLAVTKLITGQVATPRISDMQGFDSAEMVFAGAVTIFGVNVRVTVFWWIFFVILASILLFKTKFGNWIFAVGGNQESARAVGVPVRRVKITLFMFVGFAAWFVGMHTLFAFDSIQAGNGVGNEFLYIIAAVIGGCALTGGRGARLASSSSGSRSMSKDSRSSRSSSSGETIWTL